MKAINKTLCILLLALAGISSPAAAQWNTINHDATVNRVVNDIFFVSSTGYAAGWRADNVSWGSRGLLYKTTDGGLTWNTISLPLVIGNDSVQSLQSIWFLNANLGYAVAYCYTTNGSVGLYFGAILKTTDGGNTWTNNFSTKSLVNYSTTYTTILNQIHFTDMYHAVVAGQKQTGASTYDGISYNTYNGGNNWTMATAYAGQQANACFFFPNGDGSIVGGKLIGLGGPYNGIIAHSTDGGNTYNTTFNDPDYGYADVYFPSQQTGYAVGDSMYNTLPGACKGKLVVTNNGGQTWNALAYFPNFKPLTVWFTDNYTGYIGGETAQGNSGILKTTDGGITWTPENYPDINSGASIIHSIFFSTPVTGYATNGYTSSNSIYGAFLSASCSVFLGPDTTFCQQAGQLNATPGTPGNDYVFSWSPGTGLDDSTIQNPVVMHANNQQYVVTMTDTVTNCTATDTIVVSAYNWIPGPAYVCPGDSAILDFGPGASFYIWQTFTDTSGNSFVINQSTQTLTVTQPGYYLGYATFAGCGSLTSYVHVIDSCASVVTCSVDAGPHIYSCGGPMNYAQMNPTTSSGNFTYSWMPITGLSNPNIANPYVNDVINVTYTLTVTDTATGCSASDTVSASVFTYHFDTLYSCNGQPVTAYVGPGAVNYNWTNGDSLYYTMLTTPGTYNCIAGYFPWGCVTTSQFVVIDSCNVPVGNVWPGDCNYDLIANVADALHIGLAYGATGATRPSATPYWYAQPMADWSQSYTNCNYKHGDADGNGTIDVDDTMPIYMNYGMTHPFRMMQPQVPASAPVIQLVANYDTVGLQTLVTVNILLGTSALPVDSIYGISFRITSDAYLIDTTLTMLNVNSTWLGTPGTDMFHFQKTFPGMGMLDIAEVGTNHVNRMNGNGSIGSFSIVTTDNLSGIEVCHFYVSEITAVTVGQNYLTFNTMNDSVVIDPGHPAGIAPVVTPTFSMSPNPANSQVTIQTSGTCDAIEICDMLGQPVIAVKPVSSNTAIKTDELAAGVYFVRLHNGNSVTTQRLVISK